MKDLLDLIVNYGLGVVCVGYMIYFQNTTMKEMLHTLKQFDKRMARVEIKLDLKEDEDDE